MVSDRSYGSVNPVLIPQDSDISFVLAGQPGDPCLPQRQRKEALGQLVYRAQVTLAGLQADYAVASIKLNECLGGMTV